MAADLDTFLQEEVGAVSADEEEDEYGDVDWCDPDELGDLEELGKEPPSSEPAASSEPASGQPQAPAAGARAAPAKGAKEPKSTKETEEAKRLRKQAVLQHGTLALCYVARLAWLNRLCNQPLLQAALLSQAPKALEDGVASALPRLKARLCSSQANSNLRVEGGAISLSRLLGAAAGAEGAQSVELTAEEWVLLLVARCRAEGRPSRLAMRLPLPPANACLNLLRNAQASSPAQVWAEIFDPPARRWRGLLPSAERRPPGEALWVLALGPCGDLSDVTRRYARWSSVCQARGSLAKPWEQMLRTLRLRHGERAGDWRGLEEANALDQERLRELATKEPLPTSRASFRHHKLYVLNSQLKQSQLVQSAKPVGLFQGKDPIWRREDVKDLQTAVKWRQQGRVVRVGERPTKVLRSNSLFSSQLFGFWQTEELVQSFEEPARELPVGYGPIPTTNNYGNIEVKHGLPTGTVHLTDDAARPAALKLGVEFAPAVVGFQNERGVLKPTISGCVVWERDVEDVLQAAEEERVRIAKEKEAQKRERLKGAWQLLVKHVLLDLYVEKRYGSQGSQG